MKNKYVIILSLATALVLFWLVTVQQQRSVIDESESVAGLPELPSPPATIGQQAAEELRFIKKQIEHESDRLDDRAEQQAREKVLQHLGQSSESLAALMNNPEVRRYTESQARKQMLARYFAKDADSSDETPLPSADEVWKVIENIEAEGRVMAFEALSLKLEWLKKNSDSDLAYREASTKLVDDYRQRARQAAEAYDPNQIPGFSAYKKAERRIIQQVNQMQSFPDGMNRQQYLRQQLQQARVQAYGS